MSSGCEKTGADLIHLSDIQIGKRCRFPGKDMAVLRTALVDDLRLLESEGYLDAGTPRLLAVTGDIADEAMPAEYQQARELLAGLAGDLGIPIGRIMVVPGNHDVSWLKCRHYFEECEALRIEPEEPYYPKLSFYEAFCNDLYRDLPEDERPVFSREQPWTTYSFPKLGLQVLGLDSSRRERHGEDEEHYGWVDLPTLRRQLDAARVDPQPMAIALVHHNPLLDLVESTASLRNGRQVLERLDEHGVRLVLCGHGHMADGLEVRELAGRRMTVLATGSLAVVKGERPESIGNQYQIVRLGSDPPQVLRRCYDPHHSRFEADPIKNKWIVSLDLGGEAAKAPAPTVEALTDAYRKHCLRSYQGLLGSLYRCSSRVDNPLISQVFVPLKVQPPDTETEPEAREGDRATEMARQHREPVTIDDYLEETGSQPLLLAGGAGSGKTTFLRHRLGRWVDGEAGPELMLYLPLGRLGEHLGRSGRGVQRLWTAIASFLTEEEDVPFTAAQLADLAAKGRLELLLDGLDELRSELRPDLAEAVGAALARAEGRLRVILSSRPYALADASLLPGFSTRTIQDLDEEQRRLFLERYHRRLFEPIPEQAAQQCRQLLDTMAAHRALFNLGRTPLMLLGLAVVHYREGRLPHGRDEVFKALTNAVLELRFADNERRQRQLRRLQAVALAMHERAEQERDVPLPVLRGMVTAVLQDETGAAPCNDELQACLDELLGVCGLLEADGRSARFLHLGFQEYLAAEALAYRIQDRFTAEQIRDCYLDDQWWREVMAMLVSLLSRGVNGYQGPRLWRAVFERRHEGGTPVARLAQLAESLLELEPQRRPDVAAEEQQLVAEIVGLIEDLAQPGSLDDRIAAAEALGRLGDPRCSELPPTMVRISDDLEISAYPITVAQYRHFVEAGDYKTEMLGEQRFADWQSEIDAMLADNDYDFLRDFIRKTRHRDAPLDWPAQLQTPNCPVVGISWFEASVFCDWVSKNYSGSSFRLPTEDEWQLSAKGAQNNEPYPWGKERPGVGAKAYANYRDIGLEIRRPTPVGLFPSGAASWIGGSRLYGMVGNIWEWCDDTLSDGGLPTPGGLFRPVRGGGYWYASERLGTSARCWHHAAYWNSSFGFRVVRCRCHPPALGT